jgi:hypothetical protein
MEMKSTIHIKKLVRFGIGVLFLLVVCCAQIIAQPLKSYTVKSGKMYIALSKTLAESSLDSFIYQYDLQPLFLKDFIRKGFEDSLIRQGWKIELDNQAGVMLSKPLYSLENIDNVIDRITFNEKQQSFSGRFPAVNNGIVYGYNRFRNKSPFAAHDSIVTFFHRGNMNAKKVMLAGSFNDWNPEALAMTKTDSGWIAFVKLGAGKYWYKFIADGRWLVDNDNRLSENDGLGNINSVYFKANAVFRLAGFTNVKRVYLAGSFNRWKPDELELTKTAAGWELPLYLARGTYTYRFIVDGKWIEDPANEQHFPNEFGEYNSVLRIGKPYLFQLAGYTNAKQVILTGSFNDWHEYELPMKKTSNGWELDYTLGPGNYEYKFLADHQPVSGGSMIVDPNYTFRLKGFPGAKNVFLSGDFNNWNISTLPMKREGNDWVITVHLSAGKHLYKFVVDGKWIKDPANDLWDQNGIDAGNSLLWVEE